MIYLLDSNVCAIYLNQRSTPIEQRLRTIAPADIALCSVVKAELYYGAMKSTRPDVTLARQQTFLNQFISLILSFNFVLHSILSFKGGW